MEGESLKHKILTRWRTEQENGGKDGGGDDLPPPSTAGTNAGDSDGGEAAPPAARTRNAAVLDLEAPSPDPSARAPSRRRRRPADKDAREEENTQAPARKENGRKRKYDDRSAGTRDGGRGGGGGAAPTASLSRRPRALATSLPQLQPPGPTPRAADEDADARPVNVDLREGGNDKEQLLALAQEHSGDHIIMEKIKILSKRYEHFRRIRGDTTCFYRALLFSYLENLEQLEDRQAEAARLMKHVARSKQSISGLDLDKAYFSKPEFSSLIAEFNTLVKSAAEGSSSDEQFKSCLQAMKSPRIISLLRLLAEFDIRTRGEEYKSFCHENYDAIQYCLENVRPIGARAKGLAIRGLTYALCIPLRVEVVDSRFFIEPVDRSLIDEIVEVERFDFFPRLESAMGPDHTVISYWRSITDPTSEEMGSRGYLLSSDSTPLLTLMFLRKPKHWYILYRKRTNHVEQLLALAQEHSGDHIIMEKIEILSKRYEHFRRIREDTSCFYRAFLFSYLENLGQLEDRQAEATRLMENMAMYKDIIHGLELDKAYFSNSEFSSVMAEFNALVKSAAKGPISGELSRSCLQAMKSPRIISLLRMLAEADIRTREEEYKSLYPRDFGAIPVVAPMDAQASLVAIRALTFAFDIPLRVETLDGGLTDNIAKVKRFDLFSRLEPDKGAYHATPSYWTSITAPTPDEMGSRGNLLSSDSTPLLTLMCVRRPRRWYILYRKRTNHASLS